MILKSIITIEQEQLLTAEFNRLKKTATGTKDICAWFKKHPELIPGLPVELYSKVKVFGDLDTTRSTNDHKNKTIHEFMNLEFSVASIKEKEQADITSRITGIKLGRNHNTNPFFQSYYHISLNALEWPFVAVGILASLDEEELDSKASETIYKNILETHFPHHNWNTFRTLFLSGLLSNDVHEMSVYLKSKPTYTSKVVINDLSM